MNAIEKRELKKFAAEIRITLLEELKARGFGHIGGSLSVCDLLAVLYGKVMNYKVEDPHWADRDKLVCSKGHAGPAIYATLALKGFFPKEELATLNRPGTKLPSHCDKNKTRGVDCTTGSLGQGTSQAVGMALGDAIKGRPSRTFLIVGDGELNEGQCWEAAMFTAAKKVSNLVWIIDDNKKRQRRGAALRRADPQAHRRQAHRHHHGQCQGPRREGRRGDRRQPFHDRGRGDLGQLHRRGQGRSRSAGEGGRRSMKVIYNGSADVRAFKDVFAKMIPQMIDDDPNVVYLDADLMSCIGVAKAAKTRTDRMINCGIAEANMVGIAAGLAAVGFKPICHSFGPFASRRCYDQAFMSAGYAHNDITIIGTDPGVCAGYNGGTHMPFEDMAMYRALPGATVVDVTDTAMLENIFPQLVSRAGVKYLRVNRKNNDLVYEAGSEFEIGKGVVLREGKDVTIIACGFMVGKALKAAEELSKKGVEASVIDMFTVKPLDEDLVVEYAKKTGKVITVENHNKIGGLYSAVTECLSQKLPTPVHYVAVEDEYGEVGPVDYLAERFGLTAEHIVEVAEKAVKG